MGAQRGESSQFGDGDASRLRLSEILFESGTKRVGYGSVDVSVSSTERHYRISRMRVNWASKAVVLILWQNGKGKLRWLNELRWRHGRLRLRKRPKRLR